MSKTYVYIDGQNLYRGTKTFEFSWQVDLYKLHNYLKQQFKITKAFYYIGVNLKEKQKLYKLIRNAGFISMKVIKDIYLIRHAFSIPEWKSVHKKSPSLTPGAWATVSPFGSPSS